MVNSKNLSLIFCVIFSGWMFSQCEKFEDGNNFSIRTIKGRLVKGSPWVFEKLEVDGVDKSAEFVADSASFNELSFYKVYPNVSDEFSLECKSNYHYSAGDFELFEKNKIKMYLLEYGNPNGFTNYDYVPIFLDTWIEWEITRLTMKNFELKTNYFGKEYKMYLKNTR